MSSRKFKRGSSVNSYGWSHTEHSADFYRRLINQNSDATVGVGMAANAVYAAKFGSCETDHMNCQERLSIIKKLKDKYGDFLSANEVLTEMQSVMK